LATIRDPTKKYIHPLANKLARIAWSVLRNDKAFDTHLEAEGI
jgi:hypothetical protein